MTVMSWVMVATLVAVIALVGLGFAVFYPEWPPIEPEVHRTKPDPANPPDPAPQPEPAPRVAFLKPGKDEWVWSTEEAKRHRPKHRPEHVQEGTQRLPWHEVPSAPQPMYPPAPPVE